MHDVTPDLIAEIATRLYNDLPGVASPPNVDSASREFAHAPEIPAGIPAVPAGMAALPVQAPTGAPTLPAIATPGTNAVPFTTSQTSHLSRQTAELPGAFTAFSAGGSSLPAGFPERGMSLPTAPDSSYDGLRTFIRQTQTPHSSLESGLCANEPGRKLLERLFSATAAPAYAARPLDVPAIRKDFPILQQRVHGKPIAWLDNAATTQKPQSVIDAVSHFYAHDNSNIHRGAHTLAARSTDAFESARQKVQTFLGASSVKEIVLVRGTTEGINLVSQTWGRKFLQPGDEIILSTLEHHANIVPWQMVAREKGAVLRIIPVTDHGEIMLEEYQSLLGPRTKLVALAQASNSLGTILPVAEMTKMARRYNARVLIDGAQSVAHIPVNVQELDCDFFVFSGHKIFAPMGIGVVYAKEELLEIMPPWQGGGNMIRNVTFEETTYSDAPAKFEAGTPSVADTVGLGAALDYVNRLGLPNIAKYEHELLEYATARLTAIDGLRLIGTAREKVGVLSFVLHNKRTEDIGRLLDLEGIAVRAGHHCSQPSLRRFGLAATVRPSLAFYNTTEEIDRLADAVKRIQQS